jgi:hypothetical protein
MKSTLLFLVLITTAIQNVAQTSGSFAHPEPRLYELYSWPQSEGTWNFRLLPSPSGVNITVETIFDKKFRLTGVDRLKREISPCYRPARESCG